MGKGLFKKKEMEGTWINKSLMLPLLAQYGYNVKAEDDIPDDAFQLFVKNVQDQLREAMRVALISADDAHRTELRAEDADAVLKQCSVFLVKK